MYTENFKNTGITVKDILPELIEKDASFAKTLLPFAIDQAKVSLRKAPGQSSSSYVVRIEGTKYGITRTYIPGEYYERSPESTVCFSRDRFNTNGVFKKATRLSSLFNLPKAVVKVLDNNLEYCQIMFLVAEQIKNGKLAVSIVDLSLIPREEILYVVKWLNLKHFDIDNKNVEQFKSHLESLKTAKIKTLAKYILWLVTGNDMKTYITKETDDEIREAYELKIKEAEFEKKVRENASRYRLSETLARVLQTENNCSVFDTLISRNSLFKLESANSQEMKDLRAALTSPDFEEVKTAICKALIMLVEADKYLEVDRIKSILETIKVLASTSHDNVTIAKEMATKILN